MFVRNAWYVVGWSYEFQEGTLSARMLLDDGIAEDKSIIEAQQEVIARSPGVKPVPTRADRAVLAFQRIMNRLKQAESEGRSLTA